MAARTGRVRITTGGGGGGGAPTGNAGGSLTGTYPNPTIATIPSGATATTQSAADNSTKVGTTAYVDTGLALKANLASPTLTGVPLSTTAAVDTNTTQVATTAYVVGQGYAKLASPTFSGTPSLPTGTTGTTQSAADNSTKLSTTAYVDTGLALKANLASPTLTGTPAAPTAAQGTNTTQIATTAMVHSEAVLLATLASPTFTGSPVLPTGTTGVTQSSNDGSTALATDLYVDKSLNGAWAMPTGSMGATFDRAQAPQATRTVVTAAIYMTAIYLPKGVVISNFNAISAATASSCTHSWCGLFNNSRVQLATTADDVSGNGSWTADTTRTQAVATIASGASATFTTTYSGLHYVGICVVFTGTAPTIRCDASGNTIINGLAPILTGTSNTSQTTPNAFAFTATALTASSNRDYVWLT